MRALHPFQICLLCALFGTAGCTEPAETTGLGASAGGVIGAGLGAIIGNQAGDPASGLVMGAVAGSATGALIGNALEAQQHAIRTQDEALERQQQMLLAQKAEIAELRREDHDQTQDNRPAARPAARSGGMHHAALYGSRTAAETRPAPAPSPGKVDKEKSRAAYRWDSAKDPQCQAADNEVRQAELAADRADQLFHLRRALRLCPQEAAFHNALGELYLAADRRADAEFEFREALRIDAGNEAARRNLNALQSPPQAALPETGAAQSY